jgi:hypothetical protein
MNNPVPDDLGIPQQKVLHAGNLTCVYESGMIRYLTAGEHELIRCVFSAVRDRNWGTLIPLIRDEQVLGDDHSFVVLFRAVYRDTEIHFEADYRIEGTSANRIVFTMQGRAGSTFLKNRIGFCVLHPLEGLRGKAYQVTTPDGKRQQGIFPETISPVSPATAIQALGWKHGNTLCRLSFEGDVWEMEDQRNWTDASYKTYCTPLSIPFPVTVEAGTEIKQTVVLEVSGIRADPAPGKGVVEITPDADHLRFPRIGVGLPAGTGRFSPSEIAVLRAANLHHIRFDLAFQASGWQTDLEIAADNAMAIGAGIELVVHCTEDVTAEMDRLATWAADMHLPVFRVWVVDRNTRITTPLLIGKALPRLREIFPLAGVGGGTDAYFAEFNRNRFDVSGVDFVTFAVCPQVHAFDPDTLVENLEAQLDVVRSARDIYPDKNVQVSPVTLKQRFNVVATAEESPPPEDQLPSSVDSRQGSLFAAGWTFGSLINLARGGADWVTYYEATGWKGIIQGHHDPEKPRLFAGRKDDIFPVYHILRFFSRYCDKTLHGCKISKPLTCNALIVELSEGSLMIVANPTRASLQVRIHDFAVAGVAVWNLSNLPESYRNPDFLDHLAYHQATGQQYELAPQAILFLRQKAIPENPDQKPPG